MVKGSRCVVCLYSRELKSSGCQGCQIWHTNMGQICDFLRSVSLHFGSPSQNVLKLILKSPRFVPFGPNLIQFGWQIWHPCRYSAVTAAVLCLDKISSLADWKTTTLDPWPDGLRHSGVNTTQAIYSSKERCHVTEIWELIYCHN